MSRTGRFSGTLAAVLYSTVEPIELKMVNRSRNSEKKEYGDDPLRIIKGGRIQTALRFLSSESVGRQDLPEQGNHLVVQRPNSHIMVMRQIIVEEESQWLKPIKPRNWYKCYRRFRNKLQWDDLLIINLSNGKLHHFFREG